MGCHIGMKHWYPVICSKTNGTGSHHVKWNNLDPERHIFSVILETLKNPMDQFSHKTRIHWDCEREKVKGEAGQQVAKSAR